MDADSDTEIVKQSMSSAISVFSVEMSRYCPGGVTGAEPPLEGVASNEMRARDKLFPPKYK